jgi:hypothetical protein
MLMIARLEMPGYQVAAEQVIGERCLARKATEPRSGEIFIAQGEALGLRK